MWFSTPEDNYYQRYGITLRTGKIPRCSTITIMLTSFPTLSDLGCLRLRTLWGVRYASSDEELPRPERRAEHLYEELESGRKHTDTTNFRNT